LLSGREKWRADAGYLRTFVQAGRSRTERELLIKPKPLVSGDLVSLVAPSGVCDPARLELGIAFLESWGLRVVTADSRAADRYFAATDSMRAGELAAAFADPAVRAVLAVRGGSGAARLYGGFEVSAVARDPKIFVGFSDVTVLLTRLVQEAGLIGYHGPMVAADLPRISEGGRERFRKFLFGEPGWWDGSAAEIWREGRGQGRLTGGCLSVLVTTLGTPYEFDSRESILFLEDVAEKPYRIDRMLTHLKHAGKFEGVAGLVLGPMCDCDDGGGSAVLREIVLDVLSKYDFPVLFGLDAGHGSDNVVIPFGCSAVLDTSTGRLELAESAFS
jgi:muramoyltetrapeptide carboxypeptidase